MNRSETLEKVVTDCFVKLFQFVGEKYPNKELTDKPNWYMLRKWSEMEENLFCEWMINYLRKKLKITKKEATIKTTFFIYTRY